MKKFITNVSNGEMTGADALYLVILLGLSAWAIIYITQNCGCMTY